MVNLNNQDLESVLWLWFDVDGTLYNKRNEYVSGNGSIQDAHDFFRFSAWDRIKKGGDPYSTAQELVSIYFDLVAKHALRQASISISQDSKAAYLELLRQCQGANGQVFAREFGLETGFLHRTMLEHIDYSQLLARDEQLILLFEQLYSSGLNLGIFTTETKFTVKKILHVLGVDTDIFKFVVCSEDVRQKKPSLEGYNHILSLSQTPPSLQAYIGDIISKDIKPSLSTGMQAIHVSYDNSGEVSVKSCTVDNGTKQYLQIDTVYQLVNIFRR